MLCFNLDSKNSTGKICNLNWVISPFFGENKNILGALLIGKNIEFKKNNIAYFLNGIIEAIPGCLYWKDREGYYLGCNHLTAKLAGLSSPYEVIGKTDQELWRDQAKHLITNDKKVTERGKTILVEEKLKTADDQWIYFTGVKMPLRDENNEIIGLIGNSLDITELKKTQAELKKSMELAEAANHAKTEFLENMRHDIRTPLTGIVGFSEIIRTEFDDPRIQEYADNLVASSHALLHLLDEVLEAIRVSSGEIPKLKKKFSLRKTLESVINLNKAMAAQKELQLSLEIDSNIPDYFVGDKVRIHRIALELIANALNFTDRGYVKLSVKLVKRKKRELIIQLLVEDSGIGIPKNKQQDIYIQFNRLNPSYQGIYKGAGLGLSVIKQFIDDLGGEIYVKSKPRSGTTFTCVIPLQEALINDESGIDEENEKFLDKPLETTYAKEVQNAQEATTQNKNNRHVLIVEDNIIAQKVAKSILGQFKCSAEIATNGKQAVELFKNNQYDLIFMDIGLPDMDGYEVTNLIRAQELSYKTHIPIIALTAHANEENKKRCIEAGMDAVLTKPLTLKKCTDIVDSFIPAKCNQITPNYKADLPEKEDDFFNLTNFPVLDIEEGIKTMGNITILKEMLELLIKESLPEDVAEMKKFYELGDWQSVQKIAHKIKGGVVYTGALKMKMACQYLERYWKTNQNALLESLYQQMLATIETSSQEIQLWLKNQK